MCEAQTIRYAHYMAHPAYPITLMCGCVCAGNLEGDPVAAKGREDSAKKLSSRRANWPGLKRWHFSGNGNYTISKDGWRATVFRSGPRWKAVVSRGALTRYAPQSRDNVDDAKLDAFDLIHTPRPASAA
jgi:hypothetical protein